MDVCLKIGEKEFHFGGSIIDNRITENACKSVAFETIFLMQEYLWLYKRIKPNTTVIDIGACIGDSSIYFAMNQKVNKVYSYEITPASYYYGKKNMERCPLRNKIIMRNTGIHDKREWKWIENGGLGFQAASYFWMRYDNTNNKVLIKFIPLDDAIRGKKNVVIKCDAEGSEYDIFKSVKKLDNVYAIMIEYHLHQPLSEWKDKMKGMLNRLRKDGFRVAIDEWSEAEGYIKAWR
jgi:FkbM family methyltransferase